MLRCFLSERSQWTITDTHYLREPRSEGYNHEYVPYTQAMRPLAQLTLWTKSEILEHEPFHNSYLRYAAMEEDELYMVLCEPNTYWIETIVKEVFP